MSKSGQGTFSKKQFKLEVANEMYKEAFLVKKQKFSQDFPELSNAEVHQKTVDYFKSLPRKLLC